MFSFLIFKVQKYVFFQIWRLFVVLIVLNGSFWRSYRLMSRASRRPEARSMKASTTIMMAKPGSRAR